ncbi:MAG TPA: glycosyltransferase [Oleiagrimonas sp.]|nr:glycosyltransferase [Oleiagrimonas sp.]
MALDITWRLGRLRLLWQGVWRHLRREGVRRTAAKALQRMQQRGAPPVAAPVDHAETASRRDDRPCILIIDAVMPDPSRDSGSQRLCNLMQILDQMGWRVAFMPDNLHATAPEHAILDALGVQTLCRPHVRSLPRWLQHENVHIKAVMLCRHYVASAHARLIRQYVPAACLMFDTVDLHYLREQRAAEHGHQARQLRRARRTRRRELDLVRRCDVTFVVSPLEQELLARDMPDCDVRLLSNIHRVQPGAAGFDSRADLMFVGGWGHPPNRDAIAWLVHDIMPLIRQRLPNAQLHLIGDMPWEVRPDFEQPGVCIHGRIPDLSAMLHQCRVALAPLRYGAGVKGKVNTAMSHGLPVVATSVAAEGMYLTHGTDVLIADDAMTFAEQVARAYSDPALWQTLSDGGMENIRRHFSFEAARHCLQSVLDADADAPGKSD